MRVVINCLFSHEPRHPHKKHHFANVRYGMTSDTQILRILQHFGGDKRIELHSRLKSLVKLVERETRERQYIEQPTVTTVLELDLDTTATPPGTTALTQNDFAGNTEYNRTMNLIHRFNYAGWQSVSEIPVELFNTFWIIADLHPEIEFDEERDYQYFRVNGFSKRNLTRITNV